MSNVLLWSSRLVLSMSQAWESCTKPRLLRYSSSFPFFPSIHSSLCMCSHMAGAAKVLWLLLLKWMQVHFDWWDLLPDSYRMARLYCWNIYWTCNHHCFNLPSPDFQSNPMPSLVGWLVGNDKPRPTHGAMGFVCQPFEPLEYVQPLGWIMISYV